METTHETTLLTRKGRIRDSIVCCVVVRGAIFPPLAARPDVAVESRNTNGLAGVIGFASASNELRTSFVLYGGFWRNRQ